MLESGYQHAAAHLGSLAEGTWVMSALLCLPCPQLCAHPHLVLANSLLCCCRWYLQYRRSKAADLLQAKAEYAKRLQRDGVQQWLAVGLWRKQQRMRLLAEQKVRPWCRVWEARANNFASMAHCTKLLFADLLALL